MTSADWTTIPVGDHGIRLVVADMDGTLLDASSRVPDVFWSQLKTMRDRGVVFVPASGRQYATLERMFGRANTGGSYIAENGNLVVSDGRVVSVTGMDVSDVRRMVDAGLSALESGGHDIGMVLCTPDCAYASRREPAFLAEAGKYYARLELVPDLLDVPGTIIKVAVYDFGDAESTARDVFGPFRKSHQVVVSVPHWVDVMDRGTDKLRGVLALQRTLGIGPERTAVFGDYLNDLEMLSAGEWSFAMANSHPRLFEAAGYRAPSNVDLGVPRVLERLLALPMLGSLVRSPADAHAMSPGSPADAGSAGDVVLGAREESGE